MDVGDFIAEWWGEEGGRERSNFPVFIEQLCRVLSTEPPGKAAAGKLGSYEYEGPVPKGSFRSLKGTGAIDLYKHGHFIMEAKQSYIKVAENTQAELALAESGPQAPSGARYDSLMRDARRQAENYTKNLPGDHPVAPFLVIPDHPWTKAAKDAAAVRIAMTVAERGANEGCLREVTSEARLDSDKPQVTLAEVEGQINANLTAGASAQSTGALMSNKGISFRGMTLIGTGFVVTEKQAKEVGLGRREGIERHIRPYRNGRDIVQRSRDVFAIDMADLTERDVRQRFPEAYEHLLREVKPFRDGNRRDSYRERWWVFGEPRLEMRPAFEGLNRYIATTQTATHRVFQFLDASILPDQQIIVIADDRAFTLGVVQSAIHLEWALRAGGWLGLGNDSRYNNTKVFDPFPFPDATEAQRAKIAELAEELDATRKEAIAETDKLTMTELYNLREKLRSGDPMSDKDQRWATQARAGIVNRLHEQIDRAVAEAYGWGEELAAGELGPTEIVARLVALNQARAEEEKEGHICWLRPEYQEPRFGKARKS